MPQLLVKYGACCTGQHLDGLIRPATNERVMMPLSQPSEPDLPAIEHKIQSADDYRRDRELG
jgi:hypothetical protein